MCGRYLRQSDKQRIAEAFHLGELPADVFLPPDFNIAPTSVQPVIRLNRDTGQRELVLMRWGLIPYFAKSATAFKAFSTINAKAETVTERAIWRAPFLKRRCLVPADGFYEWARTESEPAETGRTGKRSRRKSPSPTSSPMPSPSPSRASGMHGKIPPTEIGSRPSRSSPPSPMNSPPRCTTACPSSFTSETTTAGLKGERPNALRSTCSVPTKQKRCPPLPATRSSATSTTTAPICSTVPEAPNAQAG